MSTPATRHEPQLAGCRARLVITEGDLTLYARDCTTIDVAKAWAKKWRDREGMVHYYGSPVVATIYGGRGHARRRAEFVPLGIIRAPNKTDRLRWGWL